MFKWLVPEIAISIGKEIYRRHAVRPLLQANGPFFDVWNKYEVAVTRR